MTARIYRYQVPVDYQVHVVELNGNPYHVGCRDRRQVEFWAVHRDGDLPPEPWRLWGTAVAPGGTLVWHLIEVFP